MIVAYGEREQRRKKRNEGGGGKMMRSFPEGSIPPHPPQKRVKPVMEEGHTFTFTSLMPVSSLGGMRYFKMTPEASRSIQDHPSPTSSSPVQGDKGSWLLEDSPSASVDFNPHMMEVATKFLQAKRSR